MGMGHLPVWWGSSYQGYGTLTRGMGQLPGWWYTYQGDGTAVTRGWDTYKGDGTAVSSGMTLLPGGWDSYQWDGTAVTRGMGQQLAGGGRGGGVTCHGRSSRQAAV